MNWFSEMYCQRSNPGGSLALQGLRVEPAFAGDDDVRFLDCSLEPDEFRNHVETRTDGRASETDQAKAKAAGGTCAGQIPKVAAEIAAHNLGQARQGALEEIKLIGRSTFLRTEDAGCAPRPEQRIFHIDC